MPIKSDEYNGIFVLTVIGDLSGDDAAVARKMVDEVIDKKQIVDVVIDCESCAFIDSDGLETLLAIKRKCDDLFGQFKLVKVNADCKTILEITRLDARFDIAGELPAALKAMR